MHWSAPALAALLLMAAPIGADAHDCADRRHASSRSPAAHVLDLRGGTPLIDAEPVTGCTA